MNRSLNINIIFKTLFLFLISLLLCDKVWAVEAVLTECKMSNNYKEWLQLSDEEKANTIEPAYCDTSANQTSIAAQGLISKVNTMFAIQNDTDELPSSYNASKGYNYKVKDQLGTGDCWAFATTSIIEMVAKRIYGPQTITVLSPRHIDYMSSRVFKNGKINEYGYNREVGTGGDFLMASNYLANGSGPVLESDMPFKEKKDLIDISELDKWVKYDVNNIYLYTDGNGGSCNGVMRDTIKKYVYKYGGVAASIHMAEVSKYYNDKTYSYYNNTNTLVNHAITIVGWDDNYSKDNFGTVKPKGNGAWLVQNSYGEDFGNGGYFYVSYETLRLCDQVMSVTDLDTDVNDNAYILDKLGYNKFYGYVVGQSLYTTSYGMNVFTKNNNKDELLKEVTFGSSGTGSYSLYYLEGNASDKKYTEMLFIGSGKMDHSGYITHKLEVPFHIKKNVKSFSIAIRYDMDSSTTPLPVSSKDDYRYKYVTVNANTSYGSTDGKNWKDLTLDDDVVLSLKAFTDIIDYSVQFSTFTTSIDSSKYYAKSKVTLNNLELSDLTIELTYGDKYLGVDNVKSTLDSKNNITWSFDQTRGLGVYRISVYHKDEDLNKNIFMGEYEFIVNVPLTSSEYKIDEVNKYIYVPPSTVKQKFAKYVNGLIDGVSIDIKGEYIYTGMKVDNVYTVIVKGDVTGDGFAKINDVMKISKYTVEGTGLENTYYKLAADVTGDKLIKVNDVMKISKYTVEGGTL